MSTDMTPRERIRAAIAGEDVDRPPISVWRHFPEEDQRPVSLAAATLRWQRSFSSDVVKFMPPGDYGTIDWGAESQYIGATSGTRQTTRFPVQQPSHWHGVASVSGTAGFHGMVIEAVRQTRSALSPDVPLIHTIFSPLTTAMKLSEGRVLQHLKGDPENIRSALARIAHTTREHALAALAAGADGFFFATQCADLTVMDEEGYRTFGLAYDLQVLGQLPDDAVVVLHLHGERPMFALQREYPAHVLNWHDRHASPSLTDGKSISGRCVAGGLNERAIVHQSANDVASDVRDALAQTDYRGLIIAPGCVVPIDTPDAVVHAAFQAVGAA